MIRALFIVLCLSSSVAAQSGWTCADGYFDATGCRIYWDGCQWVRVCQPPIIYQQPQPAYQPPQATQQPAPGSFHAPQFDPDAPLGGDNKEEPAPVQSQPQWTSTDEWVAWTKEQREILVSIGAKIDQKCVCDLSGVEQKLSALAEADASLSANVNVLIDQLRTNKQPAPTAEPAEPQISFYDIVPRKN